MRELDDMLQSLPTAYRRDAWVMALLGAVQAVDEAQRDAAREAAAQIKLDEMTFILPVEERIAGLKTAVGTSQDERRSALSAKWRSSAGKCDLEQLKTICGAWQGVAAQVDYDAAQYLLDVLFRSWGAMPTNMDRVRQALREVIPAHIAFAVAVKLLRETQADVCTVIAASLRTVYPDAEVEQWQRTAGAVQYAAMTATKNRNYTEIEVQ